MAGKERLRMLHDLAVKYLGGKCSMCPSTEKLEIHHVDGKPNNNTESNLRLLCHRHHRQGGKHVGNITITFSDEVEKELRNYIAKRFAGEKMYGKMKQVIEEAVLQYIHLREELLREVNP